MTREDKEAIVRRLKAMYSEAEDNETKEALFYAVEALQENESLARSVNEASELLRKKRPRGEWIDKKDSLQTFCSHCDRAIPYSDEYDFSDFILCPYCGSDNRPRKGGET